ncbi:hypothetical protein TWF173_003331 [Orbilia oligospora]|uniref:PH domain-containing protein n=2 Tax=Orbilia oligospora TaxID=2813651 RepID=A0A7C8VL30_ORBOL|nr:hypothetical protein TWF970_008657 [Orbilia oligospora]KAF3315764.1 hypothetical protein TWF173_003331 [Orbilia oligospora]
MAMEQLEIHSRSYLIRYVDVAGDHVISWSIQPHKKSINFGLFKHIKPPGGTTPQLSSSTVGAPSISSGASVLQPDESVPQERPRTQRANSTEAETIQKLEASGLRQVQWYGKIEAEKVTTGKFDVPAGQGGAWALVFDNTFSKQTSKTATLVLLTYPSSNPAPASHHMHHFDSPSASTLSLPPVVGAPQLSSTIINASTDSVAESNGPSVSTGFYTGILKKRKRKKGQGFARRFFSLDFTSSTLSYYLNKDSSSLRGAIPLGLAELSANEKNFEITVDSGAEVWILRAASLNEWQGWKDALNRASQKAQKRTEVGMGRDEPRGLGSQSHLPSSAAYQSAEDEGWAAVESLMGRISGIRDATRRLTTMSASASNVKRGSMASLGSELGAGTIATTGPTPTTDEKRPFWKRKASGGNTPSLANSPTVREKRGKSLSAGVGMTAAHMVAPALPIPPVPPLPNADITPHLNELLSDLDAFVADITQIVQEAKHRRYLHRKPSANGVLSSAASRKSMESVDDQEFFDANDGDAATVNEGRIVIVDNDSEEGHSETYATDDEGSGDSEDDQSFSGMSGSFNAFPPKSSDLSPLPLEAVSRRATVKGTTVLPPSLIAFFRKNVGKDLSTIAMPVSANEPLSALQKIAEQLEYSELLDYAADAPDANGERLLYIAAFAISNFSNTRAKERAIRKPFNPLLGETYELVREDKGYRFLAEKVCHRPLIMAAQADSPNWTFTQSPQPSQKFWGKSAEINTTGRVRITLHKTGDNYSWAPATTFLRNIIAGEKYVEPVGTMTIYHENTGERAQVTFKVKGMFSGRSEDVSVQVFDKDGKVGKYSLHGKWTGSLVIFDEAESMVKQLWQVGDLVPDAAKKYGFTTFAAQLNETTAIEEGKMAGTDTRLRPDQRLCEEGMLDEAENVKLELEEKQRGRRRVMDEEGKTHTPKWFMKVRETADEELWGMKAGKEGYWARRKKGEWPGDMVELYK